MISDDPRRDQLVAWLAGLPSADRMQLDSLKPASSDASFRRYFRIHGADRHSWIAMDAPPAKEDVRPFVRIASLLRNAGVHAPEVVAADPDRGFLLLTDLGTRTYLAALDDARADELMADAIAALVRWQLATRRDVLPPYDAALLRRELDLFPDWYVARHLDHRLTPSQAALLQDAFALIVARTVAQPSVYVHRDYMPRNLMVSTPNPGVLDFQDAVFGPITYDIASLMRDAFISWDEARVLGWTAAYWEQASRAGLPVVSDFDDFRREVEWMGLQRHLKVLGIFARINYRDGKPHYLADTPRFMAYVRPVVRRYDELAPLARLLDELDRGPSFQ